jgi:H+/Cl- antiporter ClcA
MAWLAFLLAGFLGFVYSWFFLLRMSPDKSFRWRDRISLLALTIASGAVLVRFVMLFFWGSDFGGQVRVAQEWTKVSVRMCAAALVLALTGRPRFIVPLLVACLATAAFWVMSTIP